MTADEYDIALHALRETFSPWAFVYFVLVIIICGFFIINLFLCARSHARPCAHAPLAAHRGLNPDGHRGRGWRANWRSRIARRLATRCTS